ncbi:putative LRR receptor-like serine/threonine-protein kinase [Nymphaea thermarum]|nr:putative LRR receptor-like serine/threonine-protein kinase [Nymphaea thermarum]
MLNLDTIDLSHNKLSGEIPKSLEKLQHIQVLDLSFNLLEGEIPSGGNFANLSTETFLGNYALCGAPKFHVPLCLDKTKRQSKSNAARVIADCAIGGSALLVIVCTLIGISCYRKRGLLKRSDDTERLQGITLPVSTKADVYSYGILLLEVFTGRKPTDEQFDGDFSLRQWVAEAFPVAISDVIDSHLLNESNTIPTERSAAMNELLVMIMEIGLSSSNVSPNERMDMKEELSFMTNQLTGHLPKDVGHFLPNLQLLAMTESPRYAVLPRILVPCWTQLRRLYLHQNMLTNVPGNRELSILTSFTNCRLLEEVDLSQNLLNSILPASASVGNLTTTLWNLELNSNQIEGTIPLALANLTKLIASGLSSNKIKGLIPLNVGQMHSLQVLLLDNNALEGLIPLSIYQLVRMYVFYFQHNMLFGSISSSINNLTSLQLLNLSSNNLSSTLPPGLCELKGLLDLYLQDNSFTGRLPSCLGNFATIVDMDISLNKLSGELPISLSKLQMLGYLNLSHNTFDGHIPQQLDHMVNIEFLDLSHNKLSGEIPKSLEKLQHIQALELSFNLLEGEIPSGGKFANLSAESLLGNYALCGPPKFHVPLCLDKTKRQSKSNVARVIAACAIGGSALLVIFCTLIGISCYRKRGLSKRPDDIERLRGITLPVE